MNPRSLCVALCLSALLPLAHAQKLTNPFFAFDNGTGRDQKVPLEEQAELVKRTGYAGLGYTGALRIPEMLQALESRGLKMFSIYVPVRLDGEHPGYDPALPEAIRQLKGHGTAIWLTVQGTAPDGEARATRMVREVADLAAASGLRVVLVPAPGPVRGSRGRRAAHPQAGGPSQRRSELQPDPLPRGQRRAQPGPAPARGHALPGTGQHQRRGA